MERERCKFSGLENDSRCRTRHDTGSLRFTKLKRAFKPSAFNITNILERLYIGFCGFGLRQRIRGCPEALAQNVDLCSAPMVQSLRGRGLKAARKAAAGQSGSYERCVGRKGEACIFSIQDAGGAARAVLGVPDRDLVPQRELQKPASGSALATTNCRLEWPIVSCFGLSAFGFLEGAETVPGRKSWEPMSSKVVAPCSSSLKTSPLRGRLSMRPKSGRACSSLALVLTAPCSALACKKHH